MHSWEQRKLGGGIATIKLDSARMPNVGAAAYRDHGIAYDYELSDVTIENALMYLM